MAIATTQLAAVQYGAVTVVTSTDKQLDRLTMQSSDSVIAVGLAPQDSLPCCIQLVVQQMCSRHVLYVVPYIRTFGELYAVTAGIVVSFYCSLQCEVRQ